MSGIKPQIYKPQIIKQKKKYIYIYIYLKETSCRPFIFKFQKIKNKLKDLEKRGKNKPYLWRKKIKLDPASQKHTSKNIMEQNTQC